MTFFQMLRAIWIDAHVTEWGFIRRQHICDAFGISIPQASADLSAFQARWPDAITYDRSAKRYLRGAAGPAFDRHVRYEVTSAVLSVSSAIEEPAQ